MTYLRAVRGKVAWKGPGRVTSWCGVRFQICAVRSSAISSRRVSRHVAATDLEAASPVGFAVHVVEALAAYERYEEGLVNRQAHCVSEWRALLRRWARQTVSIFCVRPSGAHWCVGIYMHGSGQKARLNLESDLATVVLGIFGARLVCTRGERRRWRGLRHGRWGRRRQDDFALLGDDRLLASCEPAAHRELATVNWYFWDGTYRRHINADVCPP